MTAEASRLRSLTVARSAAIPLPGGGATRERFQQLWAAAAENPSLGRLVEAHTDALAILAEAGRPAPPDGSILGVWAARGAEPVTLTRCSGRRRSRLRGSTPWCSGAGLVSHALVTAELDARNALALVAIGDPGVHLQPTDWTSPAFVDTDTRTVDFDVLLDDDAIIGTDGWYLDRPGFWHGAVGVAACWAGCAAGLVGQLQEGWRTDPHATAHLGAIDALLWQMRAALAVAADEIDHGPSDAAAAHRRALRVRHLVDVAVAEITDRVPRALGPGPLAMLPGIHRILAETDLYRRQCHAERDLEQLGLLAR